MNKAFLRAVSIIVLSTLLSTISLLPVYIDPFSTQWEFSPKNSSNLVLDGWLEMRDWSKSLHGKPKVILLGKFLPLVC